LFQAATEKLTPRKEKSSNILIAGAEEVKIYVDFLTSQIYTVQMRCV
jgi:hypothetical protein